MGIIVIPLLLAVLYFLVPGLKLGRNGIAGANVRSNAFAKLIGLTALFHLTEFLLPFVFASGGEASQIEILLQIVALAGIAAYIGGGLFKQRFEESCVANDGVVGAAFYLSAGLVPFSWFSLAENFAMAFSIKWTF